MIKYICKACDEKDPCILSMELDMEGLPNFCPFYIENKSIWELSSD